MPKAPHTPSADAALRVLYLGVENPGYPRNARIRAFLEERFAADITVVEIDTNPGVVRKARALLRAGRRYPRGTFDVVVLAELQNKQAWIARYLAWRHRAVLVVDWFVGLYETRVGDWRLVRPASPKARLWHAMDSFAARSADLALIDTDARRDILVTEYGARRDRVEVLPVGAPAWAGGISARSAEPRRLRVLYYGGYLPLHGVDYTMRAIELCAGRDDIEFVFIGNGSRRSDAEAAAARLGAGVRIVFRDSVPETELADAIAESDVVLGVFGTSPKAASVIANKVWQGLAAGRIVVTRESRALDEIRGIVGDQLVGVDPSEPAALAEALIRIASDGAPVAEVGVAGALDAYVDERYDQFAAAWERTLHGTRG